MDGPLVKFNYTGQLIGRFTKTDPYPSKCVKYCTGFHSHIAPHTGSLVGVAVLIWLGTLPFARVLPTSVLVQAVVHDGPLSIAIWWLIHPLCDNAEPFTFCSWSNNLERSSLRSK